MPYFIYKISERPIRLLEKLEQHETYREASAIAKEMRATLPNGATDRIKIVFGETELHAEDLLNEVREPAPVLGDD